MVMEMEKCWVFSLKGMGVVHIHIFLAHTLAKTLLYFLKFLIFLTLLSEWWFLVEKSKSISLIWQAILFSMR